MKALRGFPSQESAWLTIFPTLWPQTPKVNSGTEGMLHRLHYPRNESQESPNLRKAQCLFTRTQERQLCSEVVRGVSELTTPSTSIHQYIRPELTGVLSFLAESPKPTPALHLPLEIHGQGVQTEHHSGVTKFIFHCFLLP